MFKKKESEVTESIDTLIGINTIFVGNIESEATIKIDGKVNGDINAKGNVYVGENAVITGSLNGANIHISGMVEGNINSKGLLKIYSTAKLYGDIRVISFVADEGALFQGKCIMMEASDTEIKSEKPMNYKKSSVLDDIFEEKEKNNELEV